MSKSAPLNSPSKTSLPSGPGCGDNELRSGRLHRPRTKAAKENRIWEAGRCDGLYSMHLQALEGRLRQKPLTDVQLGT